MENKTNSRKPGRLKAKERKAMRRPALQTIYADDNWSGIISNMSKVYNVLSNGLSKFISDNRENIRVISNQLRLAKHEVCNSGLNHHCYFPGIWVSYNGWRYKDYYDLELVDGTIKKNMYPNSHAWFADNGERVGSAEVVRVRLVPDDELENKYAYRGESRIERNMDMFEGCHPDYLINDEGGVIAFLDRQPGKSVKSIKEPTIECILVRPVITEYGHNKRVGALRFTEELRGGRTIACVVKIGYIDEHNHRARRVPTYYVEDNRLELSHEDLEGVTGDMLAWVFFNPELKE